MTSKRVTIYDIAREAGVSATTVSRVLSGHASVSPTTRSRVQEVVDKHSFTPSSIAQGLLLRRSMNLGFILPGITHPYYAQMFTGAYQEAQRLNYTMSLFTLDQDETISPAFISQISKRRLDGVILSGGIVESTHGEGLLHLLQAMARAVPMLAICPPIEGLDCVYMLSDLSQSVRLALRHLYALGHRRIAFLGGSARSRSAGQREHIFQQEMQSLGLGGDYRHEAGHSPEDGVLGVNKLFEELHGKQRPSAIICINDLVALGALQELTRMGLKVPEDVALIGHDNLFFTPYTSPPMTTVDLHQTETAQDAVRKLVASISGQDLPPVAEKAASLVIRESCGARLGPRLLD